MSAMFLAPHFRGSGEGQSGRAARFHLGLPPRRDDPALQRRMRSSDETVGCGDVGQQAFLSLYVVRTHGASSSEKEGHQPGGPPPPCAVSRSTSTPSTPSPA